jgi:hypothetical protein
MNNHDASEATPSVGDGEVSRLEPTTETLTELRPGETSRPPKGSFRRTERGKVVMRVCSEWVVERLNNSGLTFEKWLKQGCHLSNIGIIKASALYELQPRIPEAHRWYNEHGEGKVYSTWESYWSNQLHNRMYYFFRRHNSEGKIEVALAEWPGRLENGLLVPPETPIENNSLD